MMKPPTRSDIFGPVERFVAVCALVSGIATVVSLLFITIFYSGVPVFGPLNDVAFMVQMLFTLPIVIYLHRHIERRGRPLALAVTAIGVLAVMSVVGLQALLVLGVLPFTQQIGPLLLAILVLVAWFVLVEHLGLEGGIVPQGRGLAVLAGLSFGYPVWAYRLRRNLVQDPQALRHGQEPA